MGTNRNSLINTGAPAERPEAREVFSRVSFEITVVLAGWIHFEAKPPELSVFDKDTLSILECKCLCVGMTGNAGFPHFLSPERPGLSQRSV